MKLSAGPKPSLLFIVVVCLVLAATPNAAAPATVTTTFTVSTAVQTACLISATPMNFGAYTSVTAQDATSFITVACSDLTPYDVGLNAGTGAGATVTTRKMTGPASATLNYSLYSDSARTVNWGNTVGTDTVAGTGTGAPQELTVYGRVPAAQGPAAGAYSDTITATVTF